MRLDGKEIDIDFFNEIVESLGLKDKLETLPVNTVRLGSNSEFL